MTPFQLIVLSVIVLFLLHHSLRGAFALIEKAHEHLRESDRRNSGGELVREKVS